MMPRVSRVDGSSLPPKAAAIYEEFGGRYGAFHDQVSVLAHVPPALEHLCGMLIELRQRRAVPWRYIELAIVVVSKLNACAYCVSHHSPVLQVEGLPEEAVASLPLTDHPALTDVDKMVIEYATLVTQQAGRIPERVFRQLREHFTDAQIVELTLRSALAGFYNRFNDALQIDDGEAASLSVAAVPGSTREEGTHR